MDGEDTTFKVNFTSDGVVRLRDRVTDRLKEFMGDYTDDTLVEYVIVLLRNGRSKEEARNELNVFLGDEDSESFVSWLWDHLTSNLNLYVQPRDTHSEGTAKLKPVTIDQGKGNIHHRLDSESEREISNNKSRNRRNREWKGLVKDAGDPPPFHSSEVDNIHAEEKTRRKVYHAKRSPSPRSSRRKRSRPDERLQKRDGSSQASAVAPSRLLQFAVREAVGTSRPTSMTHEPKLKRLRSVVSTSTENPSLDDQPRKIRPVAMASNATAVAIKAAAEAAKDVMKVRSSGNVFDRLGRGVDVSESGDQVVGFGEASVKAEDYGEFNSFSVQKDSNFVERSKHGGNKTMLQSKIAFASDYASENEEFDLGHRGMDASQSGSSIDNKEDGSLSLQYSVDKNSDEIMQKSQSIDQANSTALRNASRKIVNISVNVNTWKPLHYQSHSQSEVAEVDRRFLLETDAGMAKYGVHPMKENSNPVPVVNGDTKLAADKQNDSQQMPSGAASLSNVRPLEDADSRTIFVNNVHFAATKDSLSRHFNKFGEVLKVVILTDAATGQPKGSAYVEFMRKEAAEHALSLDGTSFMSRILKVCWKSAAHQEGAPVMTWPRAPRGPPFSTPRFSRASFSGGISGVYRARPSIKLGARSMQWKRDVQTTSVESGAASSSNSLLRTTRSLTYVRTEPKTDGNSGTT